MTFTLDNRETVIMNIWVLCSYVWTVMFSYCTCMHSNALYSNWQCMLNSTHKDQVIYGKWYNPVQMSLPRCRRPILDSTTACAQEGKAGKLHKVKAEIYPIINGSPISDASLIIAFGSAAVPFLRYVAERWRSNRVGVHCVKPSYKQSHTRPTVVRGWGMMEPHLGFSKSFYFYLKACDVLY